ncbi:hypothetical protein BD289DRAFT_289351 [Coniella lustricola]|uniref:Uncharacterized protein n=1 Tax=Coniella lustricola TaxID=2025994 RepID=A0A2T3A587_9PEZI|nr:hypothetical protein BD289DRAFT_289351 [Coniella lustricola]
MVKSRKVVEVLTRRCGRDPLAPDHNSKPSCVFMGCSHMLCPSIIDILKASLWNLLHSLFAARQCWSRPINMFILTNLDPPSAPSTFRYFSMKLSASLVSETVVRQILLRASGRGTYCHRVGCLVYRFCVRIHGPCTDPVAHGDARQRIDTSQSPRSEPQRPEYSGYPALGHCLW